MHGAASEEWWMDMVHVHEFREGTMLVVSNIV